MIKASAYSPDEILPQPFESPRGGFLVGQFFEIPELLNRKGISLTMVSWT